MCTDQKQAVNSYWTTFLELSEVVQKATLNGYAMLLIKCACYPMLVAGRWRALINQVHLITRVYMALDLNTRAGAPIPTDTPTTHLWLTDPCLSYATNKGVSDPHEHWETCLEARLTSWLTIIYTHNSHLWQPYKRQTDAQSERAILPLHSHRLAILTHLN